MVYIAFLYLNSRQCQKIVQNKEEEEEEEKSVGTGKP
jgi:hypothetical protein